MTLRGQITAWCKDATFFEPANSDAIEQCERALGLLLPRELKVLLLESDGVHGEYGLGLVWTVEGIEKCNLEFRSCADFRKLYMPFDCLLFIAEVGNGDQFAYRILDGAVRSNDIYVWDHETDSRIWVASSLADYLQRFLDGRIDR